jgi:dipeptidyl aminopeptidase/acylaminoacyl peptidase
MTDASNVPLIPRKVLFGNPEKVAPRLSPDGERLAYLAPKDGVLNVWVGPVGSPAGGDFEPVTDDKKRGIRVYFWAEDNTHIVYLQDEGGDENWRVHAVDAHTKQDRDLTPFDEVQAQIVDSSRHFPDALLVALNRENPELHDVYRLTLSTGDLELVARNPGNAVRWVVDAQLRVRGAMAATPDGGFDLLLHEGTGEDAGWRKLLGWGKEDALSSGPVGFTEDGQKMYLIDSRGANASRLVLLDLESEATQTLVEDPRYDVGRVVTHPETHEAQAAAVARARTEWVVLDDDIREDFEVIEGLGRGDFGVTSRDRADKSWLVAFTADEGGASYYAYDRNNKRGELLFDARPDLAEYTLARMEPVSFTSRDGLTIEGYLTLPPGSAGGPMPMILNVHGGPWVRDGWGYDPEALTPLLRRPHQDTDAHSPGSQRPTRKAGRVGTNSRRHERERYRLRISALRGRRSRFRPSREPSEVLRSRRTLPGQTPRWTRGRIKRLQATSPLRGVTGTPKTCRLS